MKALIRRLRVDAGLRTGPDRIVLTALADQLEIALRIMVEVSSPDEAVEAFRTIGRLCSRVHAEYLRMKANPPFKVTKK